VCLRVDILVQGRKDVEFDGVLCPCLWCWSSCVKLLLCRGLHWGPRLAPLLVRRLSLLLRLLLLLQLLLLPVGCRLLRLLPPLLLLLLLLLL